MDEESGQGRRIMMKVPRIFTYAGMAGLLLIGLAGIVSRRARSDQ